MTVATVKSNDSSLTDTQKANIINHIRGLQAKKLKKARKVFREGLDTLANMSNSDLRDLEINKKTITVFTTTNPDFREIQAIIDQFNKITKDGYKVKTSQAYLELGIEEAGQGFDYDYSDVPTLSVVYDKYTFRSAKYLKKRLRSSRNDILKDAVFKLAFQPNGKDAKKYLKWAED